MNHPARKEQPVLNRQHFTTSRTMEFFSEKELTAQTGHRRDDWGAVVLKEAIDNALDGCEDAGISPEIVATITSERIVIVDNGPGIPADVVGGMLDYSVRVSSREAYVAPDRGAQGNALKTLIAMPFVLDGEHGHVDIEAQGIRHIIESRVDRIRQQPVIDHRQEPCSVTTGTILTVYWPDLASSILEGHRDQFLQIARSFAFLNPHLKLTLDSFGDVNYWDATKSDWSKWLPCNPTSPHWYRQGDLARLISAYITQDADCGRSRLIREFVAEFRGLTSSAKQKRVLDDTSLARQPLTALTDGIALDDQRISDLLAAMKTHATPVAPRVLGIIGMAHMKHRCEELGTEMESFSYGKKVGTTDGLPWVIETAFAWRGDEVDDGRVLVSGVNWSAGLTNPFRQLGKLGESLDAVLAEQRVYRDDPVIFLLHAACPRVAYSDRGKSAVVLGG
jgi:DNA topoisomerase VI subunit B